MPRYLVSPAKDAAKCSPDGCYSHVSASATVAEAEDLSSLKSFTRSAPKVAVRRSRDYVTGKGTSVAHSAAKAAVKRAASSVAGLACR